MHLINERFPLHTSTIQQFTWFAMIASLVPNCFNDKSLIHSYIHNSQFSLMEMTTRTETVVTHHADCISTTLTPPQQQHLSEWLIKNLITSNGLHWLSPFTISSHRSLCLIIKGITMHANGCLAAKWRIRTVSPVLNTEMWTFQPKIESYANCLRRKKISPLSVTPSFAVFTTNTSNHGWEDQRLCLCLQGDASDLWETRKGSEL